jgi:Co/Zn/Cd efflux system component
MSITLIITLIGIVLQTLWTAVSTFSSTQNRFYRRVLIFLAFVGAIVSIVGSFIASREQQGLREAVAKQTVLLDQQEKRLEEVKAVLNLVSVTG